MKMMKMNLVVLALLGLTLQACSMFTASHGPEAATYSQGTLHATYNDTLFRTYEASRKALQDMGMTVTNAQKTPNEGQITAVMKNGTNVQLALSAEKPDLTGVDIRVGQYGLEPTSRDISKKIESGLKG
ncbi:MAG TPA: DUF3568 family protein [Dissulfurispiraceae bacterium]